MNEDTMEDPRTKHEIICDYEAELGRKNIIITSISNVISNIAQDIEYARLDLERILKDD